MRWTHGIKNKLLASIVLLALCLLVILSNYLDRIHTSKVKQSISTMYEDRLVVEAQILKMTHHIYQIRELLHRPDSGQKTKAIATLSTDFKATYALFIKTRLTKTEKATAERLMAQMQRFGHIGEADNRKALRSTDRMLASLGQLSEIQLAESKQIMSEVEAQYATIKTLSQFAFAISIIILIVLQVLVFSGETLMPIFKPKDPSLN